MCHWELLISYFFLHNKICNFSLNREIRFCETFEIPLPAKLDSWKISSLKVYITWPDLVTFSPHTHTCIRFAVSTWLQAPQAYSLNDSKMFMIVLPVCRSLKVRWLTIIKWKHMYLLYYLKWRIFLTQIWLDAQVILGYFGSFFLNSIFAPIGTKLLLLRLIFYPFYV